MKKICNAKQATRNPSFFFIVIFISCVASYMLQVADVYALNMESNQYRIQYDNFSTIGDFESLENFNLSTAFGQTAAAQFQSRGYIIKAGFEYWHSVMPFFFAVSKTQLNFDTLIPNSPKTAKTTLTIDLGAAGQYQVLAYIQGPLQTLNRKNSIPNTKCDGKTNTCTKLKAASWTSNKAYGFGYSIQGRDIPIDFVNERYFRPFPDQTASENPVIIMHSANADQKREATVTLKVNISPLQPSGNYNTIVNFIALPSF